MRHPHTHSFVILATLFGLACTGADAPAPAKELTITAATIDSLPHDSLVDGGQVCLAWGYGTCPLHVAVANWLAPDRFALWEPGRQVGVYRVGDTVAAPIGDVGSGEGMYSSSGTVGTATNGDLLVLDPTANALVRY
jgi:hypothetical protein